ncbi:MAG: phosphodiester glycosidase family protein [Nitrospinae bacterium]|nr:phosphodiester glycosidase family protein [Nitrospinota bacterium]
MGKTGIQKRLIILLLFCAMGSEVLLPTEAGFARASSESSPAAWRNLEPGLDMGLFPAPKKSIVGDSLIRILRADPRFFSLRLLNSSASKTKKRYSVKKWVNQNSLVAGINASMYQKNQVSSVSYMKTGKHVNSTWLSKDKTVLAFDPTEKEIPTVKIIDRECEDFSTLKNQYATLIQSIRMVSCKGENVWAPQNKMWSTAAVGIDKKGKILFIHVRSPYPTHELVNMLLQLPINLERAMYVEGGADAQLYINTGKEEKEFIGSYSTGSREHDGNTFSRPIPNVLGLVRTPK